MHLGVREQWQVLMQKLKGYFAYYGITGNGEALEQFREEVKRLWHKWLDRRTRRRGGMTWERFNQLLRRNFPFPPARVVHSIYAAKS
jgi:RNA-directed DNA polymerase